MYDKLIPLLGKSIEEKEIKELLKEWNVVYPKNIHCTPDYTILKGKIEKHCIRLYFGLGGNSRYLKPLPSGREGRFIAQFTMIEFTPKRTDKIPFDVRFDMNVLLVLSAAPHPLESKSSYQPADIKISAWQAGQASTDDVCRNACAQNGRGFVNTERYYL